jgi:hypothetical protein
MNFEDHWDYPDRWPKKMYDPILKVMVQPARGPEGFEVLSFSVFYDPEIKSGQYDMPIPAQLRDGGPETVWSFKSDRAKKIGEFSADGDVSGPVLRIKFQNGYLVGTRLDPIVSLRGDIRILRNQDVPIVSTFPKEFLLYVLKNYICLRSLRTNDFTKERYPDLTRIEMCVQRPVMTEVFELPLSDYTEVEPNWFCLASREIA